MKVIRQISVLGAALFLLISYGCKQTSALNIAPVDKAFNAQLLNGKGLDKAFFSSTELLQYYEIAGQESLASPDLLSKLDDYIKQRYDFGKLPHMKRLTIFFYEKTLFNDYSKSLYRDVRESENGSLPDQKDHLIALFGYNRFPNQPDALERNRYIYKDAKNVIDKTDTISNAMLPVVVAAKPTVEAQAPTPQNLR